MALQQFPLLLLLITLIQPFAKAFGCTNSCGNVSRISYPFRVRGDPQYCGVADFELVCEGSEAAFYLSGHKYLVTEIEYVQNYYELSSGFLVLRVDCPFTKKTGTCRLHDSSSFHHWSMEDSSFNNYSSILWANFMSCSQRIENDERYLQVPFLSDRNTTMYVTVDYMANELKFLHESCKFEDTFLIELENYAQINSSSRVFEVLQKGFTINWQWTTNSFGVFQCWENARVSAGSYEDNSQYSILFSSQFESSFISCLGFEVCRRKVDNSTCHLIFNVISMLVYIVVFLFDVVQIRKLVLAPLCVVVYLLYNCRQNTKRIDSVEKFLQKQQVLSPRRYTYGEIIAMTRHFKEKLGKGGFGQVYKGELPGGQLIAIKILNGAKLNGEEFINEVSTIGRIHHVNIVQLLGFCSEGTNRALVYEYMSNGSLDKYNFSTEFKNNIASIESEKIAEIVLGIAKGINYLHYGCDIQILHFDIKPHNILLDYNFTPKISDFGLAKLYPKEQTLISVSAARGTVGYMAPELISRSFGTISCKSDVYSFGMLILDIVGKKKSFETRVHDSSEVYYVSWIYDQLIKLTIPTRTEEIMDVGEMERKLCKVGLWCIQMNPSNRPNISEVVELLEGDENNIEMPPKPFFATREVTFEVDESDDFPITSSMEV